MTISMQAFVGGEIAAHIPQLAQLRIEIFRDYPYLYDGSLAYEQNYLKDYAKQASNFCVVVMDDKKIVGASTAMWLKHAGEEFQNCFKSSPWLTESIFYFGESLLLPAYRRQRFGHAFFNYREQHALQQGAATATFCAVERPTDHPNRPTQYQPLDAFWSKRGYKKQTALTTEYSWQEVCNEKPSKHLMTFWTKALTTE